MMQTYIAFVSSNVFETVNPFWAGMHRSLIKPQKVLLLSVPEYKKELQTITKWLSAIASQYLSNPSDLSIITRHFDDEDIPAFIDMLKEIVSAETDAKNEVVIDTTSAEWNYIPAALMLFAEENKDIIKTLLYQQFSSFNYSSTPYPLIPHPEQRLYNLMKVQAMEDLSI